VLRPQSPQVEYSNLKNAPINGARRDSKSTTYGLKWAAGETKTPSTFGRELGEGALESARALVITQLLLISLPRSGLS
jgi:hypothetical protein